MIYSSEPLCLIPSTTHISMRVPDVLLQSVRAFCNAYSINNHMSGS